MAQLTNEEIEEFEQQIALQKQEEEVNTEQKKPHISENNNNKSSKPASNFNPTALRVSPSNPLCFFVFAATHIFFMFC